MPNAPTPPATVPGPPARAAYRPIAGPLDRETFFAAQRRNRRASWVFALFVLLAIVVTGIPLSIVIAPLLYAAFMPVGFVMTALHPHSAWGLLLVMPATIVPMLLAFSLQPSHVHYSDAQGAHVLHSMWPVVAAAGALVVLPGAIVFLIVWLMVRRVVRRAGAGGVLLGLGARLVDPHDEEEQRLADVVEEMAVAAGVPAPGVVIIDAETAGGAANAAAIGWSPHDATVVVTRPLLDALTRDQIQAVVGRVIASIGNGDLRIALLMLSVFESVGLVRLALHGTARGDARRTLWRFARLALRRRAVPAGDAPSAERQAVMDLLAQGVRSAPAGRPARARGCALGCLFAPLWLPFEWASWTIASIVAVSDYLLTGPLVAALWRRRELLADATAVQLTRNPDGLAGALERLRAVHVVLPRATAVSYLFAAWWPDAQSGAAAGAWWGADARAQRMHATLAHRLARLVAMGAHPDSAARPDVTPGTAALSTAPTGLAERAGRALLIAVAVALVLAFVGWMMAVGVVLMSIALFILGMAGLAIAHRHGVAPH